jgi:hypothetical protein
VVLLLHSLAPLLYTYLFTKKYQSSPIVIPNHNFWNEKQKGMSFQLKVSNLIWAGEPKSSHGGAFFF